MPGHARCLVLFISLWCLIQSAKTDAATREELIRCLKRSHIIRHRLKWDYTLFDFAADFVSVARTSEPVNLETKTLAKRPKSKRRRGGKGRKKGKKLRHQGILKRMLQVKKKMHDDEDDIQNQTSPSKKSLDFDIIPIIYDGSSEHGPFDNVCRDYFHLYGDILKMKSRQINGFGCNANNWQLVSCVYTIAPDDD